MRVSLFVLLLLAVVFSGCGYHMGPSHVGKLHLATVVGDPSGFVGQAVAHEIEARTSWELCLDELSADHELFVKIVQVREENIGFRYDRNREGKIFHSVIPTEMRMTLVAAVTLMGGGEQLFSRTIQVSLDFDHDYYSCGSANRFSLGQLSDIDAARDAAWRPLGHALAVKIADSLMNFNL